MKLLKIYPVILTKRTSNESFEYWLNKLSDVSNFHGMQWHRFVSKYPLKIFWVTFIFFIIFSIPTILIFKATEFFGQNQISTSDEEISNEMANFLTMALDPNAGNIFKLMDHQIPNYKEKMMDLEDELDEILLSKNVSILELFQRVAIRCEKLISLCAFHGEFLFSTPDVEPGKKCCGVFFNPVPFFTNAGTCFTSYQEIWEYWPYTFSFIKIFMNAQSNISPELEMIFKGSDAAERKGIYYVISDVDHPATTLLQSPNKLNKGMAAKIGLSLKKTDRTQLGRLHCHSSGEDLDSNLQLPYTKKNCEVFAITEFLPDCSLTPYYGIENVDKHAITRPCGPKDMISFSLSNELVLNGSSTLTPNKCLPFCLQTEYIEKLSEAIIDPEGVESYNSLAKTNILGDPKDIVILQLYFNTFEYETIIMYQEDFFSFLSTIGGWMSLCVGASIVAFGELYYFVGALLVELIFKKVPLS